MVNGVLIDQEFEKIVHDMDMTLIYTTAACKHITDIEWEIVTIKEGTQSSVSTLT